SASPRTPQGSTPPPHSDETLMPQLSESFIDRLVALLAQPGDRDYRQRLVEDYRPAELSAIPAQTIVSLADDVLGAPEKSGNRDADLDAAAVNGEIADVQTEVARVVHSVGEIYSALTTTLDPPRVLYTLTAPATSMVESPFSMTRLAVIGVALTMAIV